jgi:hypothetical protein
VWRGRSARALKAGARLPDGSALRIPGRYVEETIGSGVTVIPLFAGFVLPPDSPPAPPPIEDALLEPRLSVTISRHTDPLPRGRERHQSREARCWRSW